ncbi:hypothetical protein [Leptospira santarosai]|uniref:hypothetical protein n=1 Tax=Leptospira santarosai TaxID=28183 RepID=UPI001E28CC71|nr:hypothetical protein [Leptospira santarosai]
MGVPTSCFDRSGRIDHDRLSKNSREKEDQTAKAAAEELIQNCNTARENLIEFRRNQLSYFVKNWRKKFKKETNHVVSPIPIRTTSESTISSVKSFRRMRNG